MVSNPEQLKKIRKSLLEEEKKTQAQNLELQKKDTEIQRLKTLATKDELTGVMNRRGFIEELERICSDIYYAQENEEVRRRFFVDMMAILYIDIDNFKKANDIYGHKMGDNVLKKMVIILESEIRRIDFIGRLGGDEFAISLVGSSIDDAYSVAEKIRKCVVKKIKLPKKKGVKKIPKITLSIGVASSKNSKNSERIIEMADRAMYEAKHDHGGNKVVKYLD